MNLFSMRHELSLLLKTADVLPPAAPVPTSAPTSAPPMSPGMSADDAQQSLRRLERLQSTSRGELLRGSVIGGVTAPIIGTVGRRLMGKDAPKNIVRNALGEAVMGATVSGAIPYLRNRAERQVETQRLKEYVGDESAHQGLRGTLARNLGV